MSFKIDIDVWTSYPLRTCRTLHECRICNEPIKAGQEYRDGGHGRRAHGDRRLPRGKTIEAFVESVEAYSVRIRMTWYQLVTDYMQIEPEQLDLIGKERVA